MTQDHSTHPLRVAGFDSHGAGNVGGRPADGDGGADPQSDVVKALHNASVACNGCTACCRHDQVRLTAAERDRFHWHFEWQNAQQIAVLDRKDDGSCVYLTAEGCGIHGKAPGICQRMDCRKLLQDTPAEVRSVRVRQNPQMLHIYIAGAERLHTLKA
ncbi:MAG: YkgJ family cysteine cluster protein [Rubrivivax sp.]|nr:YkgJ family cysteine cluster protein [Rubrivivax sp.]MDP3610916.1 YkgJ family cysteine cluster protein [Rubrivivax sp.]